MSALDLTLSNPNISAFFEGRSQHKPVAEFMYVHTHPKTVNFMSQIEVLVNVTAQHIQENPKKIGAAHRLLALAEQYSAEISDVNETSAARMLDTLRSIYEVCMRFKEHTQEKAQL